METIKTTYGTFNIYVNSIRGLAEDLLHISFVDKSKKLQIMVLQQSLSGQWEFDREDKYPDWIVSMKPFFDSAIAKQTGKDIVKAA